MVGASGKYLDVATIMKTIRETSRRFGAHCIRNEAISALFHRGGS
jgi:hypothetical protein